MHADHPRPSYLVLSPSGGPACVRAVQRMQDAREGQPLIRTFWVVLCGEMSEEVWQDQRVMFSRIGDIVEACPTRALPGWCRGGWGIRGGEGRCYHRPQLDLLPLSFGAVACFMHVSSSTLHF